MRISDSWHCNKLSIRSVAIILLANLFFLWSHVAAQTNTTNTTNTEKKTVYPFSAIKIIFIALPPNTLICITIITIKIILISWG